MEILPYILLAVRNINTTLSIFLSVSLYLLLLPYSIGVTLFFVAFSLVLLQIVDCHS